VTAEDAGIGGGIRGTPDPSMPNHVTFYVEVPDPAATLKEIEARGGKTVMGPEEISPGRPSRSSWTLTETWSASQRPNSRPKPAPARRSLRE
jgi:hypothetical protein